MKGWSGLRALINQLWFDWSLVFLKFLGFSVSIIFGCRAFRCARYAFPALFVSVKNRRRFEQLTQRFRN